MTPEQIRAAYEARAKDVHALRSLYDGADGRDLSAEERQTEANIEASIEAHDAAIERGLKGLETEARAAEFEARLGAFGTPGSGQDEVRSDADILRDIARGEVRSHEFEARDLDLNANANGEANVTDESFAARLYEVVRETTPILQAGATVVRTARGEKMTFPKVTGFSTAAIVGEGAAIQKSDPTFGKAAVDAYKYGVFLQASYEFLTDPHVGIEGFLARQAGVSLSDGIGTDLLVGDGAGKPTGVVTASTTRKTLAAAGTVDFDDLIDVQHSIKQAHRARGAWMMSDSMLAVARKVKDNDGRYIWQPSVTVGAPDVILGRPVYTDPGMAAAATLSAKVILFGDLSAYYVRLAGGVRAETSKDFAFDTDEVVWRFLQRADGVLVDSNATAAVENPAA